MWFPEQLKQIELSLFLILIVTFTSTLTFVLEFLRVAEAVSSGFFAKKPVSLRCFGCAHILSAFLLLIFANITI